MNNGRKKDVLIEDVFHKDDTGLSIQSDRSFTVWADEGLKDTIKAVAGVTEVYTGQPTKTQYHVFTDPRYDIEFIKREVEAVILCRGES